MKQGPLLEFRECTGIKSWLCLPLTLLSRDVWLKGRETNVSVPLSHLVTARGSCQHSIFQMEFYSFSLQTAMAWPTPGARGAWSSSAVRLTQEDGEGKSQTGPLGGLESVSSEHSMALVWWGSPEQVWDKTPQPVGCVLWGGARLKVATGHPLMQVASQHRVTWVWVYEPNCTHPDMHTDSLSSFLSLPFFFKIWFFVLR